MLCDDLGILSMVRAHFNPVLAIGPAAASVDNSLICVYNMFMVRNKLIRSIQQAMINVERSVTLPDERYRALVWAEKFLEDLMDPAKTPRVPKNIRAQARSVLRHYPGAYYIDQMARRSPDIIAPEIEAVHRWILTAEGETPAKDQERDPSI